MPCLFVGSSALTGASLPRNLAIRQLRRSNVWAIVPLVMRDPTTVLTHRGLSPHQLTPMSGAHEVTGANAGGLPRLAIRTLWAARIAQFWRSKLRETP